MLLMTDIKDYSRSSCGCCTGKAIRVDNGDSGYGGYRIAEDQCCCFMHRDEPMGRPVTTCSVHIASDLV